MALKLSPVAFRAIYKLTGGKQLLAISITVMLALMYWSPVSWGLG